MEYTDYITACTPPFGWHTACAHWLCLVHAARSARVRWEDVADAMMGWWNTSKDERTECGLAGREFCLEKGLTGKEMANNMIRMIDFLFDQPKKKRPKYVLYKSETKQYKEMGIV